MIKVKQGILKKSISLIMIFCLLSITGCGVLKTGKGETETDASLYFANKEDSSLAEEKIKILDGETTDKMKQLMTKLLEGPKNQKNKNLIRAGTRLNKVSFDKGLANVDLSAEFYNSEGISDVLAASSIVKSLCSIEEIERVKIYIAGSELISPTGNVLGELKENDLIFDANALMQDEENITLYFSDNEASFLVREIRRIKVTKGEPMEKLVLQELIKGPQKEKTVKTVPTETKILSVETKDGVCFVNLSSEFLTKHTGGSAGEQMTIYSIVNSLTELNKVDKVQFLIEGEKKEAFIHMSFNEPFSRDVSMISK